MTVTWGLAERRLSHRVSACSRRKYPDRSNAPRSGIHAAHASLAPSRSLALTARARPYRGLLPVDRPPDAAGSSVVRSRRAKSTLSKWLLPARMVATESFLPQRSRLAYPAQGHVSARCRRT